MNSPVSAGETEMAGKERPRPIRAWLRNLLAVVVSMGVSLVLAELSVRLLAPQPTGTSHQDRYGLAMHYPGITRSLPQFGTRVSFNRAGMRDREHTEAKPDSVFRILLLGDSFMEALQVAFESSFPSLLEKRLTELSGKRIEVVSAGVGGWGTDDELRYLTRYGLKYDPDLVLVAMTLHNDVSDNLRQAWHTVQDGTLVEQPVEPMSYWTYQKVRAKSFIATRFQLYQLWRRVRHGGEIRRVGRALSNHVLDLFREPAPSEINRGIEITDHLLTAVRDTSRAAGSQVALFLLPIRYQLNDSAFVQFVRASGAATNEVDAGRPQRVMTEIAARLGLPVIDLLPGFRQWTAERRESPFIETEGHWNAAGHQLAAEIVAEQLLRTGGLQ